VNDVPLVTSTFVLSRVLSEFAQKLGVSADFATLLAEQHVDSSKTVWRWADFLYANCGRCQKSPDSCGFLHPESVAGVSSEEIRAQVLFQVEAGKARTCPAIVYVLPE
jgi:hypothetical protein